MTQITRRQALTRGASTAAAVGAAVALSSSVRRAKAGPAEDMAADVTVLQGLYSAEVDAIETYTKGAGIIAADTAAGDFGALILKIAVHFQDQHKEHRDAIKALIEEKGGAVVEPTKVPLPLSFNATTAKTIDVVKLAADKEKQAAVTYVETLKKINDELAAELIGSIGGVETQHFIVLYLVAEGLIQVPAAPLKPADVTADQVNSIVPKSFLVDIRGAGDKSLEKFADIQFEAAAT